MPDRSFYLSGSVDSHCHVSRIPGDGIDLTAVLKEATDSGMRAILDVGISPDDLGTRQSGLGSCELIQFTSGLHPSEITRPDTDGLLKLLESQIAGGLIVAVGEIGLDYHWDTGDRSDAMRIFERQIAIARDARLPVIVHNRDADDDVLTILSKYSPVGVMHCFSQGPEFCRQCLDMGLNISFGGNLTFKRSDDIRASARIVPDNSLLVETDAPYLSPEPVRGRPNHPGHLGFTILKLAELRHTSDLDLAKLTGSNAAKLFGLTSVDGGE